MLYNIRVEFLCRGGECGQASGTADKPRPQPETLGGSSRGSQYKRVEDRARWGRESGHTQEVGRRSGSAPRRPSKGGTLEMPNTNGHGHQKKAILYARVS